MAGATNVAIILRERLPGELVAFLALASETARRQGKRLYLVGGVVRDLLLGRPNLDLDLIVEGDAIGLARALAPAQKATLTTHPRFNTARLRWNGWTADFATARAESYAHPGALPTVRPGAISDDLRRRDFTINAIALSLNANDFGDLLDPGGGRDDLARRLIRILHTGSFTDDATRIWRAVRYEQRLGFTIGEATLHLLRRDLPCLDTISGDRIRHELELALKEAEPEKVIRRAAELGVLARLHPALRGDGWLANRFTAARRRYAPDQPPVTLYLALLTYPLGRDEAAALAGYLRLTKPTAQALREVNDLKERLPALARPGQRPSQIEARLHGCSPLALTAVLIAADEATARQHINEYLARLRYVKPALTGADLIALGVPPGPPVGAILDELRRARLDGEITTRQQEEALVKRRLREMTG